MTVTKSGRRWLLVALVVVLGSAGYYAWQKFDGSNLPDGIASGNGLPRC